MGQNSYRNFVKSAGLLRSTLPRSNSLPDWQAPQAADRIRSAAFHIIDLNDLWSHFCREMIIDIAAGNARDLGGRRIVASHPRPRPVALAAVANRRGHEPKWHDAKEASKAASILKSAKSSQISLALGSTTSPAPDLNVYRNYFCHRRSECRYKLQKNQSYATIMDMNAYKIVNFPLSNGQRLFDHWVADFVSIATACLL